MSPVVVGVGSSHDEPRSGVWEVAATDDEQQPVRGSTHGKIYLVFPLPFLNFCLEVADEVSGANNELVCMMMLCGLAIGSPGLLREISTRQPRRSEWT